MRAAAAGGRARASTYSAPEAMARACPGRRLWRPEGNGYENGRRPARPGLDSLRRWIDSSDRPSDSLPLASSQRHRGGRRAGDASSGSARGAAAATNQTTAANASLRLSREEPNHRKESCPHLHQSAPAWGLVPASPCLSPATRGPRPIRKFV